MLLWRWCRWRSGWRSGWRGRGSCGEKQRGGWWLVRVWRGVGEGGEVGGFAATDHWAEREKRVLSVLRRDMAGSC